MAVCNGLRIRGKAPDNKDWAGKNIRRSGWRARCHPIVSGGYAVLYLPDVNQAALVRDRPPVYYYIPNIVRVVRKDGPYTGDYLFNLVRFAGTGGGDVIGGGGDVRDRLLAPL